MTADRERVLDTARKLLRLKDRAGTPHEALAATRALSKLLDKYRIAVTDLELSGTQSPEALRAEEDRPLYEFKRVKPWKRDLGLVIAKHFGCAYWQRTRKYRRGTSEHSMCLCGRPSDIQLVRSMYTWLTVEIAHLSVTHCRGQGARYTHGWKQGFVAGVGHQLAETRQELKGETGTAMVLYGRQEQAKQFLHDLFDGLGKITWKSKVRPERAAYFAGLEQGAAMPLAPRLQEPKPESAQLSLLEPEP